MSRRNQADSILVTPATNPPPMIWMDLWYGKLGLMVMCVLLLSLAYAPFKQIYGAWFGLVPWVLLVRHSRKLWRAMAWSWLTGTLFFSANMYWLLGITGPGMIALVAMLGLFWAGAAIVFWPMVRSRDAEIFSTSRASLVFLFTFPTLWIGFEWLRAIIPFGGLPWLFLCHTQTPALVLCQIADITGQQGVSFWVAMVNAFAALFVIRGWKIKGLLYPAAFLAIVTVVISLYGVYRFYETPSMTYPGPVVLLIQPNFPQSNTGEKGAPPEQVIEFHVMQTNRALMERKDVDLVVWSETMMPTLNAEARSAWSRIAKQFDATDYAGQAHRLISELAQRYKSGLLVGGGFAKEVSVKNGMLVESGRRNTAYYYARDTGEQVGRYDKIHIVPFGEYIPFKENFPWLYRQLISFGPKDMEAYQLDPGDRIVVFKLPSARTTTTQPTAATPGWRFISPICFEDIDGDLNAQLFRGGAPRGTEQPKSADFIVNLTNDGWFFGTQMPQHLQVSTFRSIENRAPTARCVNTGISGFIDSLGRTQDGRLIPSGTEGTLAGQLMLDRRTTFYTRWGNLIGPACGLLTCGMAAMHGRRWWSRRKPTK